VGNLGEDAEEGVEAGVARGVALAAAMPGDAMIKDRIARQKKQAKAIYIRSLCLRGACY
jgi:hypothetical protein